MVMPVFGLCQISSCQANVLRDVADELDDRANRLDGDDVDLGDFLSDLVDDL